MTQMLFGEPDEVDQVVALLREHPKWPADPLQDRKIAALLIQRYGATLNLSDEITKWTGRKLGMAPSRKKENLCAQITNWCSIAARGHRGRPVAGARAGAGTHRSTRAGGRPGDWTGVPSGRGSWTA